MRRTKYSVNSVQSEPEPPARFTEALACPLEDCGKSFKTSEGMTAHVEAKHDDYEGDIDQYILSMISLLEEGGD